MLLVAKGTFLSTVGANPQSVRFHTRASDGLCEPFWVYTVTHSREEKLLVLDPLNPDHVAKVGS